MADDKTTIVAEEEKPLVPEAPKPEDKSFANTDISEKSFEELMAEDDEEWVEEPKKEEKRIEEPKKEEKAPETPPAPQIDAEKLKEDLKKELSQEVAQKVVESLTGDKKEEKEIYPWEKEGRNPSYKEALDYVRDSAAEKVKADLKKEVEDEETREAQTRQAQEQEATRVRQAWDTYWDGQVAELQQSGYIPPIVNANDKNDPGRQARIRLFTKMQEVTTENLKNGKPAVMNLKEVYYEHFHNRSTKPQGATAPVHGSRRAVSSGEKDTFSNDEIRSKSFEDILMGK